MEHQDLFRQERPRLLALAYRMLGVRAEAEDVVQEAYLRFSSYREDEIQHGRGLLTTIVARLALNSLHSARARREFYVGEWLPEPIPTADDIDPETVSLAFLKVLETLSPAERAAFLLHEVFSYPYAEVAHMLEMTASNCRQLVHRARKGIAANPAKLPVERTDHLGLFTEFVRACSTGNMDELCRLLAHDVVARTDHGGKVSAARRAVVGADRVARFLVGLVNKMVDGSVWAVPLSVNGSPALVLGTQDAIVSLLSVVTRHDRIVEVWLIRNPEKLSGIAAKLERL